MQTLRTKPRSFLLVLLTFTPEPSFPADGTISTPQQPSLPWQPLQEPSTTVRAWPQEQIETHNAHRHGERGWCKASLSIHSDPHTAALTLCFQNMSKCKPSIIHLAHGQRRWQKTHHWAKA